MARKRAFNIDEVLIQATNVFAQYGYAGTSIDQLVEATGLQRGSIYQTFGNKAGLFREAFTHQLDSYKITGSQKGLTSDLLIVAMLERSAVDPLVQVTVREAVDELSRCDTNLISDVLFNRLTKRANILS
jgi:TetR/AcrR family transcriptional repressor of nem operon